MMTMMIMMMMMDVCVCMYTHAQAVHTGALLLRAQFRWVGQVVRMEVSKRRFV